MKIERHTVQHRLMCWGRWVQEPRREFAHSSSVFGRIREMQENAGISGDGIRYDLIEVDGDAVMCPPDGGLSRAVERRARELAYDIRCRETHAAVAMLPDGLRSAVIHVYVVPQRERPRSARRAAERLGVSDKTLRKRLDEAHERVALEIYGRFEVLPDDADEASGASRAACRPAPISASMQRAAPPRLPRAASRAARPGDRAQRSPPRQ